MNDQPFIQPRLFGILLSNSFTMTCLKQSIRNIANLKIKMVRKE